MNGETKDEVQADLTRNGRKALRSLNRGIHHMDRKAVLNSSKYIANKNILHHGLSIATDITAHKIAEIASKPRFKWSDIENQYHGLNHKLAFDYDPPKAWTGKEVSQYADHKIHKMSYNTSIKGARSDLTKDGRKALNDMNMGIHNENKQQAYRGAKYVANMNIIHHGVSDNTGFKAHKIAQTLVSPVGNWNQVSMEFHGIDHALAHDYEAPRSKNIYLRYPKVMKTLTRMKNLRNVPKNLKVSQYDVKSGNFGDRLNKIADEQKRQNPAYAYRSDNLTRLFTPGDPYATEIRQHNHKLAVSLNRIGHDMAHKFDTKSIPKPYHEMPNYGSVMHDARLLDKGHISERHLKSDIKDISRNIKDIDSLSNRHLFDNDTRQLDNFTRSLGSYPSEHSYIEAQENKRAFNRNQSHQPSTKSARRLYNKNLEKKFQQKNQARDPLSKDAYDAIKTSDHHIESRLGSKPETAEQEAQEKADRLSKAVADTPNKSNALTDKVNRILVTKHADQELLKPQNTNIRHMIGLKTGKEIKAEKPNANYAGGTGDKIKPNQLYDMRQVGGCKPVNKLDVNAKLIGQSVKMHKGQFNKTQNINKPASAQLSRSFHPHYTTNHNQKMHISPKKIRVAKQSRSIHR